MPAEQATILIPDISGYTNFVSKTEIDHSSHILNRLLETIVAAAGEDYVISEVEGDAVLMYRKGTPPSKKEIINQCVKIFTAFHRELQEMNIVSICQCGSCRGIGDMTLKFVVHFGAITEISVSRFVKASGLDMVIAHRLLKNNIDSHEYILVTKNYLNNIPDADDTLELSWISSKEAYDSIGDVEFNFAKLDRVKKSLPELQKHNETISDLGMQTSQIEIDANYKEVFQILVNPEQRQLAGGGGMKDTILGSPIPHIGSKHICVADDFSLEVENIGFTQTEKELTLIERQRILSMNYFAIYSSTITDLGNNRTLLTMHIKPEEGHELPIELLSVIKPMEDDGLNHLKAYAEKKLRVANA
ncbi:MAG TPA: DUF2652 domain-containing protein [Chitinophagales bacterium]|nr:DUF2652 domain-containing protein [Chitinophagales bacterium]